ncbi:MAG: hypothetical protein ACREXK_06195 [Gammaproteobacteria bacterium]
MLALVLMFGVYTLLDGVCTMVSTVRSTSGAAGVLRGVGGQP